MPSFASSPPRNGPGKHRQRARARARERNRHPRLSRAHHRSPARRPDGRIGARPVRAPAQRRAADDRPPRVAAPARGARGHRPRVAGRRNDRAPRDAADRAPDEHGRGDRPYTRCQFQRAAAGGRRRGRRTCAHAAGHAQLARRGPGGDRGDARAPATLRGGRLARAAHAADERARKSRAAGRSIRKRPPGRRVERGTRRSGALGAALLAAHAPARCRPAAAGPQRRRAGRPARARRPRSDRARHRRRARLAQRRARAFPGGRPGSRGGKPRRASARVAINLPARTPCATHRRAARSGSRPA